LIGYLLAACFMLNSSMAYCPAVKMDTSLCAGMCGSEIFLALNSFLFVFTCRA
jgi:hypothetical protein